MWLTLFGFALILMPFAAIVCFESRLKGLLAIFAFTSAFHLLVALATQAAHLFSYPVIFSLHLCFGLICVALALKRKKKQAKFRLDWFVLAIFGIIFLFLFSLHYFYTGPVAKTFGVGAVSQSSYPYPFYSDEWVAVALIDYSIEDKSLPLMNPLGADRPFDNLLVGFHSFLAEIFLLLNLAPLTHYAWLAIINGLFVCAGVYFTLRLSGVGVFASGVSAMSVVFITNSGNLAGIWYLLPFNLSLTFFLLGVIGFLVESRSALLLGLALSLVIYPPMVAFVLPVVLGAIISNRQRPDSKLFTLRRLLPWLVASALAIVMFVVLQKGLNFANLINLLVRERESGGVVSFAVWNVLPIFVLPFAVLGLWDVFKRKINYILFPTVVGLFFWAAYNFLLFDFIITPPRVVAITAVFLVIASGFGIDWLYRYLREEHPRALGYLNITGLKIGTLAALLALVALYPSVSPWQKLVLEVEDKRGVQTHTPASPITRYLTDDDLKLFEKIKDKRFISPAWKGLAIGVATRNYPLDSKASTITNKILKYDDFMEADCAQKSAYAEKFEIDYVYSRPFSCDSFVKLGSSEENLILYSLH